MSTYIQVYKNKSKYSRLYLVIFLVIILIGVIGLVMTYIFRLAFIPVLNEASYFFLIFHSIISILFVRDSQKKAKYFVSWNESEIRYLLPKSDNTELIKIEEIKSIVFNRSEVMIELNNSQTKRFNLNYFFFPERKTIKNFFEEINKPGFSIRNKVH